MTHNNLLVLLDRFLILVLVLRGLEDPDAVVVDVSEDLDD